MIYTIENSYYTAQVSTLGAELQSLVRRETGFEYLWQGDPAVWSGRSPILFPVVGRLLNDCYRHNGATYAMPKHGFVMHSEFTARQESAARLTMTLDTVAYRDIYPFDFLLEVTFELAEDRLLVTHRVTNRSGEDMPFSLGAHPAFNCEMGDAIFFPEDESAWAYRLTEEKLLTGQPVEMGVKAHTFTVTEDIFKEDALIFRGVRSDRVTLLCGGRPRVTVEFGSAPCLGVWAKPGAKYVCIEPWHGLDDSRQATGDIFEKPHIVRLEPGSCFRFPVTIIPHA